VGERHQQESGIAEMRERRPADEREQHAAPPAYRAEIGEALADDQGKKG